MTSVLPIIFPVGIAYGATGGPSFSTDVVVFDNGEEQRVSHWDGARLVWDVSHGLKDQEELDELIAFFREVRGRAYGFLFKDWSDHRLRNQAIGTGDGAATTFQILKTYGSANRQSRRITRPRQGTLALTVGGVPMAEGVHWTCDYATGFITFLTPPAAGAEIVVTAGEFWVPARFDTDSMRMRLEHYNATSWGEIPVVELME